MYQEYNVYDNFIKHCIIMYKSTDSYEIKK